MDKTAEQDPRIYFAAERTFLAWIRTGLGLMGVGFAVSRFSLFLREIAPANVHAAAHTTGLSVWSGVALVGLGVIVILSSILRHIQLVRELSLGTWIPGRVSKDAIVLGVVLAGIGVVMCVYLIGVR
jgi:putative membrane protein